MSRAKKCDRCETLYEPVRGCVWIETYNIAAPEGGKDTVYRGYEADLCPKCSAQFIAFLGVSYADDERPEAQ